MPRSNGLNHHVRFGSKADLTALKFDFRYTPESGHRSATPRSEVSTARLRGVDDGHVPGKASNVARCILDLPKRRFAGLKASLQTRVSGEDTTPITIAESQIFGWSMFDIRAGLLGGPSTPSDQGGCSICWSCGGLSPCGARGFVCLRKTIMGYEPNKPLFGSACCPRLGSKGASARIASCSRRLDGL
jgi:hypothetical protein